MKKIIILSLLFLPFFVWAQRLTEFNRNGNEAMERKDYEVARFWYEEGIASCDPYSINKLTDIWKLDVSMHVSMRVVMGKCLECLSRQAQEENDTLAITKLIDYYTEGIGTDKNELSANFWKGQLEQLRRPPATDVYIPPIPKERMKFFAGYHASPVAPFGIQVGGMGKTVGWYIRLRSNLSFQDTKVDCEVKKREDGKKYVIIDELEPAMYRSPKTKKTWLMGSAGIIYKVATNLYVSTGIGYFDHKYAREYIQVDDSGKDAPGGFSGWAKDTKKSINGVAIDLDGTYVFNGKYYISLGASMMKFNYVYPNAGVGIYF